MKLNTLIAAAGLLALPPLAFAAPININFDNVQDGTVINNSYAAQGITFAVENASPFSTDIQATANGGAFSSNALDATVGVVDVLLNPAVFGSGLSAFQVTSLADPQGFGSPNVAFRFYGANNSLLFTSAAYDQTKTQTLTFSQLGSVSRIALPADAYYDNFSFTATPNAAPVPEASSLVSLALLLAGGGLLFAKRRKGANAA